MADKFLRRQDAEAAIVGRDSCEVSTSFAAHVGGGSADREEWWRVPRVTVFSLWDDVVTVNLYEVLGAKPTDDAATLRRAFIDAARLHHPDRHAEDDEASRAEAEDRMRLVNQAWSVLGDARRRASYDAQLVRTASTPTKGRASGRTTREPSSGIAAPRWMTILPAAMMAVALSCLVLGFVTRLVGLMAFGVAFALAAAAAFVLVPVATMNRSRKRERPA